jgi:hypothetical protein
MFAFPEVQSVKEKITHIPSMRRSIQIGLGLVVLFALEPSSGLFAQVEPPDPVGCALQQSELNIYFRSRLQVECFELAFEYCDRVAIDGAQCIELLAKEIRSFLIEVPVQSLHGEEGGAFSESITSRVANDLAQAQRCLSEHSITQCFSADSLYESIQSLSVMALEVVQFR